MGDTMVGQTLAYQRVDGLSLVVHHAARPPTDYEWDAWIAWTTRELERRGVVSVLVVTGLRLRLGSKGSAETSG
jgi:hypothetical protein